MTFSRLRRRACAAYRNFALDSDINPIYLFFRYIGLADLSPPIGAKMFRTRDHESRGRRFARHGFDFLHRHFHGHHHGPGGRRSRVFDHGDLRLVILQLIAEKPRHGYEIIKAIEERLAGAYSPSPGTVYPTLTMLEELGQATVALSEGGKKLYTITAEGEAYLAANKSSVDAVFARIAETGEAHGGGRSPQIIRAVENFKLALRLRLSRGALGEEQIRALVAILDRAAGEIERS
jgi:DNA-binding PadR family transcriptional regulator